METHYTKKASAYILKAVLKENPKASKLTTFDEAFVLLMDKWELEGSVETTKDNITRFQLFRDNEVIKEFTWEGAWLEKEGDWNWNLIYKDVLETVLKTRLYKKPKVKRTKTEKISIQTKKVSKSIKTEKEAVKSTKNKKTCKREKSIK